MSENKGNKFEHHCFKYHCCDLALSEFDLGGVLYHANYFRLFERAREALLTQNQLPYHTLANSGSHLAVLESKQNFLQPVTYGVDLIVTLWVTELKAASVRINYELHLEKENRLAHRAWMRMVYVEKKEGGFKMQRLPKPLRNIFADISWTPVPHESSRS